MNHLVVNKRMMSGLCVSLSLLVFGQSSIRWCTISEAEQRKCQAMSQAFAEVSIRPSVRCVNGGTVEGCAQKLQVGQQELSLNNNSTHLNRL